MPLYEYECESCRKRFEKIRKFSDPPLETCDLCGTGPIRKLFSSPAIKFKGSGFYITDYAKKSSIEGEAGGAKTGSSESDSSTKSDASTSAQKSDAPSKTETPSSKSESSSSSGSSGDSAAAKTTTKAE